MTTSWPMLILGTVCLLALGDLVLHLIYALVALPRFENHPAFAVQPPPADAPVAEPVRIRTTAGLELAGGVYFPLERTPLGVVVFCPETDGSYLTAMNYASVLVEAGFIVVSFNFRNHPPSDSLPTYHATHWMTTHEIEDVQSVLDFVRAVPQFGGLPIGLFGVSRGAGAALAAGADRPEVQAVWAQGPFSTHQVVLHHTMNWLDMVFGRWAQFIPRWHVAITIRFLLRISEWRNGGTFVHLESYISQWRDRSVQFVCGARDSYIPSDLLQELCRQGRRSLETELWIVPHAKHNQERVAAPVEFDQRVIEFFDKMAQPNVARVRGKEFVAG